MKDKLVFEEIQIGDELLPVVKAMSQEIINQWAEASRDFNALHVDPEYAKTTRFGGTIAHGYISLSYLNELMTNWLFHGWISGGKLLDIKLVAPVRPGDRITARGKVVNKMVEGDRKLVECEVWLENQDGVKAATGRAVGIVS